MSMFTRTTVHRVLIGLIVSATAAVVFAASPHYKKGGTPVCTTTFDSSTGQVTANCTAGSVTGLGNGDILLTINVSASQGQLCHNKGNPSNIVPGQNPAIANGSTAVPIDSSQVKNGNLDFPAISTSATLVAGTWDTAGCPNSNWTVTLSGTPSITGCFTFQQPVGTTISALSICPF
jgi:hypothetical protein